MGWMGLCVIAFGGLCLISPTQFLSVLVAKGDNVWGWLCGWKWYVHSLILDYGFLVDKLDRFLY